MKLLVVGVMLLMGCKKKVAKEPSVPAQSLEDEKRDLLVCPHPDIAWNECYPLLVKMHPLVPLLTVEVSWLGSDERRTLMKAAQKIRDGTDKAQFDRNEHDILRSLDSKQLQRIEKIQKKRKHLMKDMHKDYEFSIIPMNPVFLTDDEQVLYAKTLRRIEISMLGNEWLRVTNNAPLN
jgi:hypothetical protein